jgi:hypothetical protein
LHHNVIGPLFFIETVNAQNDKGLGFDSWRGLGIFLSTTTSRMALGPTQPPIQWVPEALSLGVKQLGHEADHSPPSSAEVKECMALYLHSPNTPSWRGAQEKQAQGQLYLYLYYQQLMKQFTSLVEVEQECLFQKNEAATNTANSEGNVARVFW